MGTTLVTLVNAADLRYIFVLVLSAGRIRTVMTRTLAIRISAAGFGRGLAVWQASPVSQHMALRLAKIG